MNRLLYFSDLKALFHLLQRRLWCVALLCVCAAFAYLLFSKQPCYTAQATFQQAQGKYEEMASLQTFLKGMRFGGEESSAASAMQSKRLLAIVCKKMGLQVEPLSRFGRWKTAQKNLYLGLGVHREEAEGATFCDVSYEGESRETFYLNPLEQGRFELLDAAKSRLVQGELGIPLQTTAFKMTVLSMPTTMHQFQLLPIESCVQKARAQLKIKKNKIDSQLLELSFSHTNRKMAQQFVDRLMLCFQEDLLFQHNKLAEKQLAFLQKRKDELQNTYDTALAEHSSYLTRSLGDEGLIGLTQQVDEIVVPKEEYTSRLDTLDVDLRRWQEIHRARQLLAQADQKSSPLLCEDMKDVAQPTIDPQFVGVDLPTAQKFYAEYSCQKDELIAELKELAYVQNHLKEPHFEITALTKVMEDPVSLEMIQEAARLSVQLCDENNRSLKEQERLKEALEAQKRFIASHLDRTVELVRLKLSLVDRKMAGLQKTAVELISSEKVILQYKLDELKEKMHTIPERWRLENQLKLKREMTLLIMEGMAQLTESKLVDHHLFAVSSRPLDFAYAPPSLHSNLLFLSLIAGLLGASLYFIYELIRRAPNRIPLTAASARGMGAQAVEIGQAAECLLKDKPQVIALFTPLQGLEPFLESCGYRVKRVSSGEINLSHKESAALFSKWREGYEFILIDARLTSLEMRSALTLADKIVVPLLSPQELSPLLDTGLQKTLFVIYEKENFSDRWSRLFRLAPLRRAPQARA